MVALITSCAALGVSIIALVITLKNKKKPDFVNIRREEPRQLLHIQERPVPSQKNPYDED